MTDYLKITEFHEEHTEIEVLAPCDISWSTDFTVWHTMVYGAWPGSVILDWAAPDGHRRSYGATSAGQTLYYPSGGAARGMTEAMNGWFGEDEAS